MGKLKVILGGETQSLSVVCHGWILSIFLQLSLNKMHKATPDVFIATRFLHEHNTGKRSTEKERPQLMGHILLYKHLVKQLSKCTVPCPSCWVWRLPPHMWLYTLSCRTQTLRSLSLSGSISLPSVDNREYCSCTRAVLNSTATRGFNLLIHRQNIISGLQVGFLCAFSTTLVGMWERRSV